MWMDADDVIDINTYGLFAAFDDYCKQHGNPDQFTMEYLLLSGVNDTLKCAQELVELLRGKNVYVNLIPYNETSHIEYKRSSNENVMKFYDYLKKKNINVTVRREFGGNIDAACGQLRANEVEK